MSFEICRRRLVGGAALSLLVPTHALAAKRTMTAAQVAERIRDRVGVPWRSQTVDGLKAGSPETLVTGMAVTGMATLDVLRAAVAAGANMIVSLEPTFYSIDDKPGLEGVGMAARPSFSPPSDPPRDPVVAAKKAFVEKHGLVIWRLYDHWAARPSRPFVSALAQAAGFSTSASTPPRDVYTIPEASLAEVLSHVRSRLLSLGGLRVVGNPETRIRSVRVMPGLHDTDSIVAGMASADLAVVGETRDFVGSSYAFDAVSQGRQKALILVGRVLSEEPAVPDLAAWLHSNLPECPVRWLPRSASEDIYWSPAV